MLRGGRCCPRWHRPRWPGGALSAPVAMLMRLTSATVPAWQVGISLGLLVLTGLGTIRLMARLFRAQALLSGEPLSVRRFLAALRA